METKGYMLKGRIGNSKYNKHIIYNESNKDDSILVKFCDNKEVDCFAGYSINEDINCKKCLKKIEKIISKYL